VNPVTQSAYLDEMKKLAWYDILGKLAESPTSKALKPTGWAGKRLGKYTVKGDNMAGTWTPAVSNAKPAQRFHPDKPLNLGGALLHDLGVKYPL
jgi:hypothetical protein